MHAKMNNIPQFAVIEIQRNRWTGYKEEKVILEGDSEALCYKHALEFQKKIINTDGPWSVEYVVREN